MLLKSLLWGLLLFCIAGDASPPLGKGGKPSKLIKPYKRAPLQNIVTWDEHSLFVHGERVLFYSGEFHPYRLPVPGLWLDVFQKIRALGYTGVSFYTDWALLEGERGTFRANGIFALEEFFDAASTAGIYLLARPGPYINAESSGGGYPGWLQQVPGQLRTPAPSYLKSTQLYVESISKIIAKAQITNGGPVILLQPENEYTDAVQGVKFPNGRYFQYVEDQYRNAGIVVPFISNDAAPDGHFAPGSGNGSVQIYGHDSYPLGFDCSDPEHWPAGALPTDFYQLHEQQSPTTPYSIVEFQGGSFDPWGGPGFDQCLILLDSEFERVFYKNDYSFGVTIINFYMTYGGTNWGNLGHPGDYTSYDYAAVIAEDRSVARQKYSDAKLLANFLMASPTYLTSTPGKLSSNYTNAKQLVVTPLFGNGSSTNFYILRHKNYSSRQVTKYKLSLSTKAGKVTVPQLGGDLTLNGRDSKIHVSDYRLGGHHLQHSTAEIFTWQKTNGKTVLVVYGGPGEHHELALSRAPAASIQEGEGVKIKKVKGTTVLNWETTSQRKVVKVSKNLFVYILDRSSAYDYWVLNSGSDTVVVKAGYLLRNATVSGNSMSLVGDVNATTPLEVISGAPTALKTFKFNGQNTKFDQDSSGVVTAMIKYAEPSLKIPKLLSLKWKYHDSLPEIKASYDDSMWTDANMPNTLNTYVSLKTPMSLFSADYNYTQGGSLVYRGHFKATGKESTFSVQTQGGMGYGHSAWLDDMFLGSWTGTGSEDHHTSKLSLGKVQKGKSYVLTVLIDHMGFDENFDVGDSGMKNPRGILDYHLSGRSKKDIKWKLTGNLGGEHYQDLARGPLNEGAMYAERQGWHLPDPPSAHWKSSKPSEGISKAGVGFYSTSFDLNIPSGYDVPMSFVFDNSTNGGVSDYRVQLFVNGYQFGKYVNNIGPQTSFRVPQGILNYHGTNWLALTLWAQDASGAKVSDLKLQAAHPVQSGYGSVALSPMPAYKKRKGAY